MNTDKVKLTKRESEIAELFAWGATKKDVANRLTISIRTVENIARNIFQKTGVTKINELSAWWFCTKFKISFELSPLRRAVVSVFFLIIITPQVFSMNDDIVRVFRTRSVRSTNTRGFRSSRSRRKGEDDIDFDFLNM